MPFDQLRFSIPEMLSLLGLANCVYVMVYMLFRSGDIKRALLPFAYFFVLGSAFFLDFAARFIGDMAVNYGFLQWFAWFMGPPLSVLLVIQVAQINRMPALLNYWVLLLVPLGFVAARRLAGFDSDCMPGDCPVLYEWLIVMGLVAGAVSLLAIWGHKGMMDQLYREKAGKDRYWLILTLVIVNVLFLGTMLLSLTAVVGPEEALLIRTVFGLAFVYLAGTSLFRIYPQAVRIVNKADKSDMSGSERELAEKVESLLDHDKIYHEPAYSRTDLARELDVAETVISRVINSHFGKSFPQLLNERRVEDAKRLLEQTEASVKVIAAEVGFNSTASFNRVFRDMTGTTPSAFRNGKAGK